MDTVELSHIYCKSGGHPPGGVPYEYIWIPSGGPKPAKSVYRRVLIICGTITSRLCRSGRLQVDTGSSICSISMSVTAVAGAGMSYPHHLFFVWCFDFCVFFLGGVLVCILENLFVLFHIFSIPATPSRYCSAHATLHWRCK